MGAMRGVAAGRLRSPRSAARDSIVMRCRYYAGGRITKLLGQECGCLQYSQQRDVCVMVMGGSVSCLGGDALRRRSERFD